MAGERRDAVVQAAFEAVDRFGADVSMATIADGAAIQRPNLYRLFESRDQLDAEVAALAADQFLAAVDPEKPRSGTTHAILVDLIRPAMRWASEHPHVYRFVTTSGQPAVQAVFLTKRRELADEMVTGLQAFLGAPVLDDAPPHVVVTYVMSMTDAAISWHLDHPDEDEDALVQRLARHIALIVLDMGRELGVNISPDEVISFEPGA